jgi:hypothetical protein
VARKPNYDFEKRRKEQERQAKKEAKREDKLRRKREGIADETDAIPADGTPVEGGEEPRLADPAL